MIYSIKEINRQISKKVIQIIIILVVINTFLFSIIYFIYIDNAKELEKKNISNIANLYIDKLEATIKTFASQEDLYNLLFSNYVLFKKIPESRKAMLIRAFSVNIFNGEPIVGYKIKNDKFVLFTEGKKTQYYIAYKLCYRDNIYDKSKNSICPGELYLFFDKAGLEKLLESKNLFLSNYMGEKLSQVIRNQSNMAIDKINLPSMYVRSKNEVFGIRLILLFLCSLLVNIAFVFFIKQRSRKYYTKFYVEPILAIYNSLSTKQIINKNRLYTKEIRKLIDTINKAQKRSKLDTLSQIQHDLKPAFVELQNIANNLTDYKNKKDLVSISSHISMAIANANNNFTKIENISYIIKQTISSTYFSQISIIDLNLDRHCFAKVDKSIFYRIISNLINNSLENNKEFKSLKILITTKIRINKIIILVQDNGIGIPDINIGKIFNKGVSFNKSSGTGLYFCKKKIEQANGTISCSSDSKKTIFKIKLPLSNASCCYIDSIYINGKSRVVVIDDEYPEYIDSFPNNIYKCHLKNKKEIIEYFNSPDINRNNDLYLVDYHLGNDLNGLEIIHKYGLVGKAYILSTAGNMLQEYIDTDRELIPIFEKSTFEYINFVNIDDIEYFILEDNIFIANTMVKKAKRLSKRILVVNNFLQFNMLKKVIKKDANLILDIHIQSSSINGVEYVNSLNKKGYSNIAIQTGDSNISIDKNIRILEKGEFI